MEPAVIGDGSGGRHEVVEVGEGLEIRLRFANSHAKFGASERD